MAATESTSPADRLKKARGILEQKELLKLARLELVELRKQARAEAEEAAFAERCGNREAICEAVDELEKQSVALDKALAKAAKHYIALEDCVRSVSVLRRQRGGFRSAHVQNIAPAAGSLHVCHSRHRRTFGIGASHHLESLAAPAWSRRG